ncbi:hypothetical protein AB0953_00145 [Streptomyces sp. NPDC046866]|uniref:hypothetical protein n=1 Tax=Streptomyces sp. NPDC046866 TaxID=3154921 RepID=UPI00345358B8
MTPQPPAAAPVPGSGAGVLAGARQVLQGVLGLGVLLLPLGLAPVDPAAVLAVAVASAGWCLLVSRAGGTAGAGAVGFVRERLGPRAGRAATALYFGGFATGQAAVALGAADFACAAATAAGAGAADGDSGWRSYAAAGGILAAAAGHAWLTARGPSPAARRLRLAAVLALAAGWRALGGIPAAGAGTAGRAAALVALPLLFGWVGLEGAVPGPPHRRRAALAGTLLGLATAAALYAVLLGPLPGAAPPRHPAAAAALGAASATLCWAYCRTNLQATALRWTELTGRSRRGGVLVGALVALCALALAGAAHGGVSVLLLGPGAATAALFCLIALAALRRPRPKESLRHDHEHHRHRVLQGAARPAG